MIKLYYNAAPLSFYAIFLQKTDLKIMLIQFSVKNFLSFKEEQCLSMQAAKRYSELSGNVITVEAGGQKFRLLRSVVLYGANAAGKTNLLMAMQSMERIVRNSASPNSDDITGVMPFLFDDKTAKQPSEFESVFIVDGVRYQYGFSASKERIINEWLFAFPRGRQQRWFERSYNFVTGGYKWEFGAGLLGEKELWKKSTRPTALFLSTAVNLNSKYLKPIADWFVDRCRITMGMGFGMGFGHPAYNATTELLAEGKITKKAVQQYLHQADLDITDFSIEEKSVTVSGFPEGKTNEITTTHKVSSVEKQLSFALESAGTHKMFAIAGPWIHALEKGLILFVDELNAHLHPHLLRYLVEMFHDPTRNKSNAQLIFTTHDSVVLNDELLRRDQIWFCQKDKNQSTELYSLADFKDMRSGDNVMARYLSGRYGAIPVV